MHTCANAARLSTCVYLFGAIVAQNGFKLTEYINVFGVWSTVEHRGSVEERIQKFWESFLYVGLLEAYHKR